jgi:hypothetical protein
MNNELNLLHISFGYGNVIIKIFCKIGRLKYIVRIKIILFLNYLFNCI